MNGRRIAAIALLVVLIALVWAFCAADGNAGGTLKTAHYEKTQGGGAASDLVILKCEDWSVGSTSSFVLVTRTLDTEGGIRSVYRCIGP